MRQIATLVLAALLVVGTVPALGAAGGAQHGTDGQYTTDLGSLDGATIDLQTDADRAAANETGATITGYEVADRTLAPGESLRLRMNGSGEGSTPVVLTVDGERAKLATVDVDGERVAVEPDGDLAAEPIIEDIDCEGEFNSLDDWWIRCEITLDVYSIADGSHDVGVNGLPATEIDFRGDDGSISVTGYEVADRTIGPDEPLRLTVEGAGESGGDVPLVLSIDGERRRLGTVSVTEDGASVEEAAGIPITIHCEGGYNAEDGWWFRCEIRYEASLDGGSHDVGVDGMEPTGVAVGEDLRLTGYEFAGTVASANDSAVTVSAADSATIEVRAAGVGETPIALSVDGERHRLGRLSVTADGASFERAATIPWPVDVEVECYTYYDLEEDRPVTVCDVDVEWSSLAVGSHDVGVDDMEPTEVTVEAANPGPLGPIGDLGDVLDLLLDGLFGG